MVRTICMVLAAGSAMWAQDGQSAIPRSNQAQSLRNAIAGLGKKPLLPAKPEMVRMAVVSGACVTPMREMAIENPEQYTMRRVPLGKTAPMPTVTTPVCPAR